MAKTPSQIGYGNLVVSRKTGEAIVLGDGLATIRVSEVRGNRVRLHISAPHEMSIHREEIQNDKS